MSLDITGVIRWLRCFLDDVYALKSDIPEGAILDDNVTENSGNAVKSSGIYAALTGKSNTGHTHTKSEITNFPTSMTPTSHASSSTTYGAASTSNYGHAKLSTSTSSTSTSLAATPSAVKAAYDLANHVNYEITSSNYNPNIDSTITITVKATNQAGNAMGNHTFTLTLPDGSTVSKTTDSSGVATHSYTCNTWGVCRFSIKTFNCFINVKGWRIAHNDADYTVKYTDKLVSATIHTTTSASYSTSFAEWGASRLFHGDIDLRPPMPMSQVMTNGNITIIRDNSYKFGRLRLNGSSTANGYAHFLYARR